MYNGILYKLKTVDTYMHVNMTRRLTTANRSRVSILSVSTAFFEIDIG